MNITVTTNEIANSIGVKYICNFIDTYWKNNFWKSGIVLENNNIYAKIYEQGIFAKNKHIL